MLDQFKAAILGANNIQAPSGGPNANAATAGVINNLQNLSRSTFQLGASGAAAGAAGGAAGAQADQETADAKAKLAELQQQQDDLTNPDKWQRVVNNRGGYDFYDGQGNKVSAQAYSQAKGIHITDAIKGSEDPNDVNFIRDYKDTMTVGDLMQRKDKAGLQKLFKQDPSLQDRLKNTTFKDVVGHLRQTYPDYFGQGQAEAQDQRPFANKTANPVDTRGTLQKIKDSLTGHNSFTSNANYW